MVGVFDVPAADCVAAVFGLALLVGVAASVGVGGWWHGWLRRIYFRRRH